MFLLEVESKPEDSSLEIHAYLIGSYSIKTKASAYLKPHFIHPIFLSAPKA